MVEKEVTTPGSSANERFVSAMRDELKNDTELVKQIPEACLGCSTAWLHTVRGRVDRLQGCKGLSEETFATSAETLGQFSVTLCHLP